MAGGEAAPPRSGLGPPGGGTSGPPEPRWTPPTSTRPAPDQQVAELRADERILLESLHPQHARLVTNLQAITPRAQAELRGGAPHEVRLRCDTLWLDTDRGTASLVWRGNLRLALPGQAGRVVVRSMRGRCR